MRGWAVVKGVSSAAAAGKRATAGLHGAGARVGRGMHSWLLLCAPGRRVSAAARSEPAAPKHGLGGSGRVTCVCLARLVYSARQTPKLGRCCTHRGALTCAGSAAARSQVLGCRAWPDNRSTRCHCRAESCCGVPCSGAASRDEAAGRVPTTICKCAAATAAAAAAAAAGDSCQSCGGGRQMDNRAAAVPAQGTRDM